MINIIPTLTVMDTLEEYENMVDNYIASKSECFRCNATRFSNEIYEQSINTLQVIYYKKTGKNFKLMLDIPCPKDKYRIEFLRKNNQISVEKYDIVNIVYNPNNLNTQNDFYIAGASDFYKENEEIVIGDGDVVLKILSIEKDRITCSVKNGGEIGYRKACYFGNEYCHSVDRGDLIRYYELIEMLKPEYVALSFVENACEVQKIRREIETKNCHAKIISKIESEKAIGNIASIINESDGILIGRGDLALSSGYAELPSNQENIIKCCKDMECKIWVATDIVNSLCNKAYPSRAEVCDVHGILKMGVDYIILSGPLCRYEQYNNAVALINDIEANIT